MAVSKCLVPLLLVVVILMPHVALALTGSQVYENVKDSVVVVMATDRAGKAVGLGSGVVLPSGAIVTNYHVVKAGVGYTVSQRGRAVPASLQASNPENDLALLLAPGLTATPARLGQASQLKVGEPVYAVGAPQGLELSISEGIVSQLRGGPPPLIQTTVAISPGSSGGGLFNAQAELVGITTFYLKEGQNLNFALPVEWVREVAATGKAGQGATGKEFNPDDWVLVYELSPMRGQGAMRGPVVPAPEKTSEGGRDNRANNLVIAEDWQGLLTYCRQWTRAQPDTAEAWFYLGFAYLMLKRYPDAIEAYRETLRFKPHWPKAWYALGCAYYKLARPREAIEAYREALRLEPDDALSWYNLGLAYDSLRCYQGEIEAYREALRLGPKDASAWNNLAIAYYLSGTRAEALEAVKELRKYDPQRAEKLFSLIIKP